MRKHKHMIKEGSGIQYKIGILGGTFNPVHLGHLMLAEAAYDRFGLDTVLLMVSPNPPHKTGQALISAEHRCKMVQLAAAENPHLEFSDFELNYNGSVYTSHTVKRFKEKYPDCEIFLIIGGDSLFSIESWKCPEEIFKQAIILSGKRINEKDGASGNCKPTEESRAYISENESDLNDELDLQIEYLKNKYGAEIYNLNIPTIEISSSEIIAKLKKGESVRYYMPDSVLDYIMENKLWS